ncbi:unnamed protein product [Rotaria sordida]|uniref:Protein kinase domain-containing protein n=1 Tax=Rotaria sordida TaxID=392033 RepID=A0A813V8S5_9BILA|nr:unnamed protein product [Rotaria sordida]
MKLLTDGELFYRIRTQTSFSEKEAGQLMKKLILTIIIMHNNDLCHRDFKPENLLFSSSDSNAEIKIIDFDFAKQNVRAVNVTMRAFQKADQFQLSSVTNGVLARRRYDKKSTDSCLFTSSLKITRPAQQKFGQQDSKSECDSYECFRKEIRANQKALEMAQIKVDQLLTNGSDFSLIQDSLSSTQQQSARRTNCLIFASGTLAPLATYFGELTISFDTQMNLLLEYNHDECDLVLLDVCQHMPYDVLYLLNVTLTTVEQLNYAQRYRILMCFKATDQRKMK